MTRGQVRFEGRDLLEFEGSSHQKASIKVVGVGGGGGNALNNMIVSGLQGVEFVAANTDAQALQYNRASHKIQLGAEITRGPTLDMRTARQRIRALSKEYGLEVDPNAYVEDLPVGLQQRVEIVKALYREAQILVLDEPTAVLTPQEAEDLFHIMHQLTDQGVSIIFITHKLKIGRAHV